MGFRFRKSIRVLPGVRINLSGKGASLSVGRPGATVNFSQRGTRVTAGLPGTGLSWSQQLGRGRAPQRSQSGNRTESLSAILGRLTREVPQQPDVVAALQRACDLIAQQHYAEAIGSMREVAAMGTSRWHVDVERFSTALETQVLSVSRRKSNGPRWVLCLLIAVIMVAAVAASLLW